MRGKRLSEDYDKIITGITPADAGKTVVYCYLVRRGQDHPRGCGENRKSSEKTYATLGSPPRMRGKRIHKRFVPSLPGITPADAGKTD